MPSSILDAAKANATSLINSGFGGHVRVYPDRILIMDTKDERSAKKVWQWNYWVSILARIRETVGRMTKGV
ncbi:hypothetical protein V5R22_30885 [Bacillus thuringiensis]|uniref:hypothetical protein n=1 Tax=Bacillus thuringiensis TaxID=1428 RepID=UPI003D584B85